MKSIEFFNIETGAIEKGNLILSESLIIYNSTIQSGETLFKIEVRINPDWSVNQFQILKNDVIILSGKKSKNLWHINQEILITDESIDFIDISITPFTNTLPINFMKESNRQKKTFPMLFLDVEKEQVKICHQAYSFHTDFILYENMETNYSNQLTVDEDGIVSKYPNAFKRII